MLEIRIREKIVEALVLIEHLEIFSTVEGLTIFGSICEMLGRCCRHVAAGDQDQGLRIAMTVGRSVPHAFPLGKDRDALETVLEEIIEVLETPKNGHLN